MKKVYYLCHCGNGTTVFMDLLDLVKDDGTNLLFHKSIYDWDLNKDRVATLRAKRVHRLNYKGELYTMIDFHSTKEQFKFSFILEREIPDNAEPEKSIIEN